MGRGIRTEKRHDTRDLLDCDKFLGRLLEEDDLLDVLRVLAEEALVWAWRNAFSLLGWAIAIVAFVLVLTELVSKVF